jgi:predicted dehydrogenase
MGVCSQMGNQGSALNGLRRAVELVQAGTIGPVTEVHVWTNRPVWDQAPDVMQRPPEDPVPSTVHWDQFIGPAPMRPYAAYHDKDAGAGGNAKNKRRKSGAYHPFNWRGWWDFGTGALGDMACHTANMAYRALNLGYPTSVVAEAKDVNPETYPTWAKVVFEFPARGPDMPAVKFHWYEGKEGGRHNANGKRVLPPEELLQKVLKKGEKLSDSGSMLVGSKGILFSPNDYGAKFRLMPEDAFPKMNLATPEKLPMGTEERSNDPRMKEEWVAAIKAGKPELAYSNFDIAGMLTESILLGNIAIRLTGQKLAWDGPSMQFTNNSAANQHLHYEYRKGWTL